MQASNAHKLYFLGIGGIGMSALARYFHDTGRKVHGYDLTPTPLTRQLEKEGMLIHYDADPGQIPGDTDCVIYTPAIPSDHAELEYIRNKGIPLLKRAEVIGQLSSEYRTIAVAGTHGKTSICAIAAHLLRSSGQQLTAFVGGIMKNYNSNLLLSKPTEVLLVEADEYDRSFLKVDPDIAVISAIDADHLDVYGDFAEMEKNYLEFANKVDDRGLLILNEKLKDLKVPATGKLTYGFGAAADLRAENIRIVNGRFHFDMVYGKDQVKDIRMIIPGRHYIENALAAAAISLEMGLSDKQVKEGLETFRGVERRFDVRIENDRLVYIDDYAHHPEEIEATIKAARELYPDRKITGVFQPHLFTRTKDHAAGFAASLEQLDEVILLDIYPAREQPIPGVTSEIIYDKILNKNKYLLTKHQLLLHLDESSVKVLITLGAGDIGLMINEIESILKKK